MSVIYIYSIIVNILLLTPKAQIHRSCLGRQEDALDAKDAELQQKKDLEVGTLGRSGRSGRYVMGVGF